MKDNYYDKIFMIAIKFSDTISFPGNVLVECILIYVNVVNNFLLDLMFEKIN